MLGFASRQWFKSTIDDCKVRLLYTICMWFLFFTHKHFTSIIIFGEFNSPDGMHLYLWLYPWLCVSILMVIALKRVIRDTQYNQKLHCYLRCKIVKIFHSSTMLQYSVTHMNTHDKFVFAIFVSTNELGWRSGECITIFFPIFSYLLYLTFCLVLSLALLVLFSLKRYALKTVSHSETICVHLYTICILMRNILLSYCTLNM